VGAGYRAEARRTVGLDAVKLGDALAVVRPFLEPLLIGIADGEWDQAHRLGSTTAARMKWLTYLGRRLATPPITAADSATSGELCIVRVYSAESARGTPRSSLPLG